MPPQDCPNPSCLYCNLEPSECGGDQWCVECECGLTGPVGATEQKAVQLWNAIWFGPEINAHKAKLRRFFELTLPRKADLATMPDKVKADLAELTPLANELYKFANDREARR